MGNQEGVTPGSQPAQPIVKSFEESVLAAAGISEEAETKTDAPAAPEANKQDPAAPNAAPEGKPQDGAATIADEDIAQPTEFKPTASIPKERFDEVNARFKRSEESKKAVEQKLKAREDELVTLKKRISELSPEEKEDYDYQRKIGAANEEARLSDSIESLKEQLSSKDAELSAHQAEIESLKKKETESANTAFIARLEELEKKFDGSNGLPKFDRKDILAYAEKESIYTPDPYKLYAMKFAADIAAARVSRKKPDSAPATGIKTGPVDLPPKGKDTAAGSEDFKKDVVSALYAA